MPHPYIVGTTFALMLYAMVARCKQFDEVNVLASAADWAWPAALSDIFKPRGVNLLMARGVDEFVEVIGHRRIQTAIIDMDSEKSRSLATIKIIRKKYPWLPCLLLTNQQMSESLLGTALKLEVFSVIAKPVDMNVLRELLDRLFKKKYGSNLFERM